MGEAFTGYILLPIFGNVVYKYVVGGFSVSGITLIRVLSVHICLGFVILGLMVIHMFYLHKSGRSKPLFSFNYLRDVIYFHSYFTIKDFVLFMIVAMFVIGGLVLIVAFLFFLVFFFIRINRFLVVLVFILMSLLFSCGVKCMTMFSMKVFNGMFMFDSISFYLIILVLLLGLYRQIMFYNMLGDVVRVYLFFRLGFTVLRFCVNHCVVFWCVYELSMLPLLYLIFRESPYSERFLAG
ncbi:unnamed protein product [Taenia asiatica]|uniref:Cytochrome b n=1 Tax=Taenia asiatica TaxID=60517 RepID=A0A0R3W4Z8_TAEAS|nr:unnamed protein product [Taenia asiatica]